MKLLLVLLTVMTFTIEKKNEVSMAGLWPYDIVVDYANTGTKGNVGAGDKATLSLSGLENIQIESVTLYLQSNQSSGAGVISIKADGTSLYSKSGTYQDWFGAYNNTTYQSIGWSGKKILNQGTLVIEVTGTESSLHIEKYEIVYSNAPERPYTVTLVMDNIQKQITETELGSGIVLPICPDVDGWFWEGWSTEPIAEQVYMQPYMLYAGDTIYPKKDMTLWAVWTDVMPVTWEKQCTPQSGYYSMELHDKILFGAVDKNGLVPMIDAGMVYLNSIYYIDFKTDSTCTIEVVGGQDQYIGYDLETKSLRDCPSEWKCIVLPDSTWLFSAAHEGEFYWMCYQKNMEYYAWLHEYKFGVNPNQAWALYALPDPYETIHWWSYPVTHAVVTVNGEGLKVSGKWIIPFGIYDLIIRDGQKYLRLKE